MRPYIIIFSTITIDGKLASVDHFSELSCPYDKERQHILRSEVDAILVGGNTVRLDNPSLTSRRSPVRKDPVRVVISKDLNLNPSFKVFQTPPPTIVYSENPNPLIKKEVEEKGVKVRVINPLTMKSLTEDLYALGVRRLMVEGGGKTIWSLIREDCFDEIRVTISPRIFGSGVSLAQGEGFPGKISPLLKLKAVEECQCGQEVHLIYVR
ncbi:2,5-diamino-6-(ribosylamino)-4(3H)-pyrimidinone 5'-phosphate reductase [Acidianus sp. RZ1]|uniref:2,5-diamino-6-(ribosylamino)-4(3H)-pyrimidinone 5'-phosphate reductase n=1 Tax=Acidianus sp. RZ1 TaxID=1540082 RepID=UPI001491804B|nr:2,5-diamino-6-(ribosylamino)-4(3H)-pyrimidinone 5'-phosphate reductase [Acidianus sp. RZ1]NON62630.1 2,5-diamino-6-(ribosylamino)-4(3H)-pyrimidinone 5'-phosphate reductase [Acidianus sp. RZ1]